MIIQKYVGTEYNEKLTSLNHFDFHLSKKEAEADAKIPYQILNRLQLQLKNLGSDQLRLRNTELKVFLLIELI